MNCHSAGVGDHFGRIKTMAGQQVAGERVCKRWWPGRCKHLSSQAGVANRWHGKLLCDFEAWWCERWADSAGGGSVPAVGGDVLQNQVGGFDGA